MGLVAALGGTAVALAGAGAGVVVRPDVLAFLLLIEDADW